MREAAHIELLLQGVEVWNRWRSQNLDVVGELWAGDFSGMELEAIDLRRTNCNNANFSEANLSKGNLKKVVCCEANLKDANLFGTNLEEAYLEYANLAGANLERTTPIEARLKFANLQGANLSRSSLYGTDFTGANLNGAQMPQASLHRTIFRGASLRGVNLSDAQIEAVVWDGADITDVNLSHASLLNTVFRDLDLSTVRGLDSVDHPGPCTVGVETLLVSQEQVPKSFWLGCGVPNQILDAIASLTPRARSLPCFLCYWHEDEAFAFQLRDKLMERGIYCWMQENFVLHDPEYPGYMNPIYKYWHPVLLCVSQKALASSETYNVLHSALQKEIVLHKSQGRQKSLLMVLDLDGFVFKGFEHRRQKEMQSHVIATFNGWENDNMKMQEGLELVVEALRTDGGREEPPKSLL